LITNAQKLDLDRPRRGDEQRQGRGSAEQVGEPDPRAVELVKGALVAKRQLMRDLPSSLTGLYQDTPLSPALTSCGGGRALNDSSQATGFAQNPTRASFSRSSSAAVR